MHEPLPASALALRWSARLFSIGILAFWGFFLSAHVLGSEGAGSRPLAASDQMIFGSMLASLAGLVIAWRYEAAGAMITLAATAVCTTLNWRFLMFPGTLIPITALLFLAAHWLSRATASRSKAEVAR